MQKNPFQESTSGGRRPRIEDDLYLQYQSKLPTRSEGSCESSQDAKKDYSKLKAWSLHVRMIGVTERGGKLVVRPLPDKLIAPASAPPPEAEAEIESTGILNVVSKKAILYTDGAPGWPKAAKRLRRDIKVRQVSHKKQEMVRRVRMNSHVRMAGTQTIDSTWKHLDRYVPATLKVKIHGKVNPLLWQYVYSFVWRRNIAAEPIRVALRSLFKSTK